MPNQTENSRYLAIWEFQVKPEHRQRFERRMDLLVIGRNSSGKTRTSWERS
jgi:hypothetical protein